MFLIDGFLEAKSEPDAIGHSTCDLQALSFHSVYSESEYITLITLLVKHGIAREDESLFQVGKSVFRSPRDGPDVPENRDKRSSEAFG